jgi:hypothetical protein
MEPRKSSAARTLAWSWLHGSLLALAGITWLLLPTSGAARYVDTDRAIPAQQTEWEFSVYLDDRPIGSHRFSVLEDGPYERVQSEASYEVRVLFVTLFRYQHRATEVWNQGCLRSLESQTRINGRSAQVQSTPLEQSLRIEARDDEGSREFVVDECVSTFAYWNRSRLRRTTLINSQTGEPTPASIDLIATEEFVLDEVAVMAHHYRLTAGDDVVDLWYEADSGAWIGLAATVENGRRLAYRLHQFNITPVPRRVVI